MLSQKHLKALKKEVNEKSALGVGFLIGIEKAIPDEALYDAIRQLADEGDISTLRDADFQNRLVTTSIEHMNYQDFKEVAPYLFSYRRADLVKDTLLTATPLPATPSMFEAVKGRGERLFEELVTPADALEELLLTNGLLEALDQDYDLEDIALLDNMQLQKREQSRDLEHGREL